MPCTNPSHIYTRSTFLNKVSGSYILDIPCGKCEDCVNFKRMEWLLRAYYEWLDCKKRGGFGLFDTLTLNPQSLLSRSKFGVQTFSKNDLRLFLKKFRKRMSENDYEFRYLITCEYGEKKHRPHYHVLFFIIPPDNSSHRFHALRVNDMIKESWTEPETDDYGKIKTYLDADGLIKYKMRSLGFNDMPHQCIEHIIDSPQALRYVTKYITKDDEYYKSILNIQKVLLKTDLKSNVSDITDWFKNAKPFHLQSLGFGSCALADLEIMRDEIMQDPRLKVCAIDNKKPIPIPLYYLRKLFYDLHPTSMKSKVTGKTLYQWRLTKIGKLFKSIQIEKRVNRYAQNYADLAANACTYCLTDGREIYEKIHNLLDNRSWKDYSIYRNIYKGHFNDNKPFVEDTNNWLDFYSLSLELGDEENYNYIEDLYERRHYRQSMRRQLIDETYNPNWEHFDEITNYLDFIQSQKNIYLQIESKRKEDIRRNLSILKPD